MTLPRWHRLQVRLRLAPGQRSLRRHLMVWLLLPQLILWLAAAYVTYHLAARYANGAIDRSLYQSSRALAQQVKPIGNGLFIDFPKAAQAIIEADPDDRVYYMVSTPPGEFILGNNRLPPPPPIPHLQLDLPYFYDGMVGDVPVRVAALYLAYGEEDQPQRMLVQLAKSRTSREELARQILIDTALPLSGLIVLMSLIVWGGIRTGLAPLARLRNLVEDRAPNDLAPIQLDSAPEEVRALAKALNTLLAEVRESVDSQKRFISNAAHQLRTPLAGLKSQAELALAEASDPAQKARLQRVQESATRSAHLVAQLLTLARAEPESAAVQARSRFDLQKLARELTAEQVPRALHTGVDLGCDDGDERALEVLGNALLIREALQNLIDNAIRYAGRGATVTVRCRRVDTQALIEIEDDGPGLPPDPHIHERVFERFVRATHEGSGCGLGLAIVKEIVERHAGSVALAPVSPHGLRVTLKLPLAG
ncbi:sensor histidine kinase [Caldimonas brevitalea]|uniref:histidine kinase n=1 Tax=Caldimonas brevitalea TaxID=413882 RepID=A0A0G3BPF9_9BURK|nr:sensor histidine kinase [Caldimonas brevitalea]AKJ28460.1 histidine kinase [Caldimonas brevitalea]